ncbi:invasion associated locus B family protein [Enterovirga rhinocerotis]|nr:invasion associated locus B family protein [Enterovirga rhinocerotis]
MAALAAVIMFPTVATANVAQTVGNFEKWSVLTYKKGKQEFCYLYGQPTSKRPTNVDHGDIHFFVQKRTGSTGTEASFQAAYPFKKGSVVQVEIGDTAFRLATSDRSAWLLKPEREAELLATMKRGADMTIAAVSARGTDTSYVFSLQGVTAASTRLMSSCP